MHLIIVPLALLLTTALAKDPWVSSFYHADCTGPGAGDVAHIDVDACATFDPIYDAVAVNFGAGYDEVSSISVFSDANCEVPAAADITSDMADYTPQQCVSMSKMGKKWGSVQKTVSGPEGRK